MEKQFEVKKFTNGMGHKHLVVITQENIEDQEIGTVIIIPYAEGFKQPTSVVLQTDENGLPMLANEKFGIILQYIYE